VAAVVDRPEDLYGVELGDFVAERNALAARLKASGDVDAAAAVKALRKPPKSAWALNSLARAQPELVQQVLDAANAVVAAINDGGDPLRAAQSAYSRAVTAAVDAAADRSGVAGDAVERMRATVLAAGADPDGAVAAALRSGTLVDDAAAPGFSFVGVVPGAAPRPRAVPPDRGTTDPADTAAPEADTAAAEAEAAQRAVEAAERAAQRRRARERERLQQQLERLEQRVGRLGDVAEAAEAAAVEARAQVTRAQGELDQVRRQLEELGRPQP
jgi:valyl-tRNA synthetase